MSGNSDAEGNNAKSANPINPSNSAAPANPKEEAIIDLIKKANRWRLLIYGLICFLSITGASGLTWKMLDKSIVSDYKDLEKSVKEGLNNLNANIGVVDIVARKAVELEVKINELTTSLDESKKKAISEITGEVAGMKNAWDQKLEPILINIEGIKTSLSEADETLTAWEGYTPEILQNVIDRADKLDADLKKMSIALNPFDNVDVEDLQELINLDPWDIKINALRALETKYVDAVSAFTVVINIATGTRHEDIKNQAWDTAEAVFQSHEEVLDYCVYILANANESNFQRMLKLIQIKLITDEKKVACVGHFAKHMLKANGDSSQQGRLILAMGQLFMDSDIKSIQALRTSFSDILRENLDGLLVHEDRNVRTRTIKLTKMVTPASDWEGALVKSLHNHESFPLALQIILNMDSVNGGLIQLIKDKKQDYPTYKEVAEAVIRKHGG